MSVIVEWVRRSGVSSSKEVDFRSSSGAIPKEALIPNMRRTRANATRSRVLRWKNTFSTLIQKWFNSYSMMYSAPIDRNMMMYRRLNGEPWQANLESGMSQN